MIYTDKATQALRELADFANEAGASNTVVNDLIATIVCQPALLKRDAPAKTATGLLPTDPAERKHIPIGTGVLDYFPAALAEIATVSFAGNEQHNRGQPLHWARGKSTDQADTLIRHFLERGQFDVDGHRHSAKMAWRALALLQLELEEAGAPISRGSQE